MSVTDASSPRNVWGLAPVAQDTGIAFQVDRVRLRGQPRGKAGVARPGER